MQKIFRFITLTLFFLLFLMPKTFALPPIMPLERVQEGMQGTAYTVIESSGVIEPFNVRIMGTMDNGKGSNTMILAKASGNVIDRTKGILQGMSGSPVYINGRLVGAVAAGFKDMDPTIFLITPIENMLKIWEMPDEFAGNPYIKKDEKPVKEKKSIDEIDDGEEIIYDSEEISDEEKAAVIYSGFDSRGLNFLQDSLSDFGLKNYYAASGGGETKIKYNADLQPGGAVGVSVVMGDFLVGATGTVTAVDENKILAFGHSFTHGGNVNYFMTDANVLGAVTGGSSGGMKIASVANIIGKINQDRETGIAGVIGKFPPVVPINVTVNEDKYSAVMAYNETLIPKLGSAIAYTALSKTADSLAESTVDFSFDIKTNVIDSGTFSRSNIFYSPTDVGQVAVTELLQALTLVSSNTVKESDIFGIDVNINYETGRKTASLVRAEADKKIVKPGDTVNLTITLQPYRKPEEKIVVPFTVPLTAREGNLILDIHGGGLVPVVQVQTAGLIVPSTKPPAQSYSDKINALLKQNKNNQIIIGVNAASTVVKSEKELKKDIQRAKKAKLRLEKLGVKPAAAQNNKFDTGYIIDNVIQCTLNVDKI